MTIVIPTYNMQDYLRRCLDSLIVPEEQMKQLEVLVVNDGSKDNSSAIAHVVFKRRHHNAAGGAGHSLHHLQGVWGGD